MTVAPHSGALDGRPSRGGRARVFGAPGGFSSRVFIYGPKKLRRLFVTSSNQPPARGECGAGASSRGRRASAGRAACCDPTAPLLEFRTSQTSEKILLWEGSRKQRSPTDNTCGAGIGVGGVGEASFRKFKIANVVGICDLRCRPRRPPA